MSEETIIDQNQAEQSQNQSDEEKQSISSSKKEKKGLSTAATAGIAAGVGATAGVASAFGAVAFFPNEGEIEDSGTEQLGEEEIEQLEAPSPSEHLTGSMMDVATNVNDSMSFNQAFAAARQEVGPGGIFEWHGHSYGTYYANEWNSMSAEERDQYWADVHHTTSHMPEHYQNSNPHITDQPIPDDDLYKEDPLVQENLNDSKDDQNDDQNDHDINIDDNSGNVYQFNGDGDINIYINPDPSNVPGEEPLLAESGPEPGSEPLTFQPEPEPLQLSESDVLLEFDVDEDGSNDVAFINANDNETADLIFDTTGNGEYDTLVVDPVFDDAGNLIIEDGSIQEISGITIVAEDQDILNLGQDGLTDEIPMNDGIDNQTDTGIDSYDDTLADYPDVDDFASLTPDPNITIDNNMDMGDFV